MIATRIAVAVFASLLLVGARPLAGPAPPSVPSAVATTDQEAIAHFRQRVRDYHTLRSAIEREQGEVVRNASPEEVERRREKLMGSLSVARRDAEPGDIFDPPVQRHFRRVLGGLFAGPEGTRLRSSILDAHTDSVVVRINRAYPSKSPRATMPLRVLDALPALPDDLEYRFVRQSLVLVDARARMIVDYMDAALP